jgi:hypothetical protein
MFVGVKQPLGREPAALFADAIDALAAVPTRLSRRAGSGRLRVSLAAADGGASRARGSGRSNPTIMTAIATAPERASVAVISFVPAETTRLAGAPC